MKRLSVEMLPLEVKQTAILRFCQTPSCSHKSFYDERPKISQGSHASFGLFKCRANPLKKSDQVSWILCEITETGHVPSNIVTKFLWRHNDWFLEGWAPQINRAPTQATANKHCSGIVGAPHFFGNVTLVLRAVRHWYLFFLFPPWKRWRGIGKS